MPWDDFPGSPGGHGTHMAGLVGANDNDQGYVGTMPEGLTVSMKIAHNEHITRGDHDGRVDKIEEDDFYWAVDWATRNGIDVLSMSFTSEWDKTIVNVLDAAYNRDDILLLSSTGNTKGDAYNDPQEESAVMGVGGLNSEGESIFVEEDEEVSGLSGGGTLDAYCPSPDRWCEPSGRDFYDPYYYDYDREEYIGQGGTSASTAIAAGIAGLVRAHNPNMSASEVRQRLVNTADGPHNKLNAAEAVTGN